MDQTQLQQQIALYYSKLPPNMQTMFSEMKWMDILSDISKKYNLTEEQKASLGAETTLVLLGMIDHAEYEKTLESEIVISAESIQKMITDINTQILSVVKSQLSTTFEKNKSDLAEEKYGGTQKLDERFSKLPQEVQVAISESNYQAKLYAIAEKHKLSINYMGALDEATTKVMLGIIHPDKYETELQNNIAIPKEEITEIVNEVNEDVLKNIREILKGHWGKETLIEQETDEDEVPIPPYALPRIETVSQNKNETNIYADSGIEIMKSDPEPNASKITSSDTGVKESIMFQKSGIKLVDEVPAVSPLKITPKTEASTNLATSIIGDKLKGSTTSASTTTDYSLPKITKDAATAGSHDPYHEPIE